MIRRYLAHAHNRVHYWQTVVSPTFPIKGGVASPEIVNIWNHISVYYPFDKVPCCSTKPPGEYRASVSALLCWPHADPGTVYPCDELINYVHLYNISPDYYNFITHQPITEKQGLKIPRGAELGACQTEQIP